MKKFLILFHDQWQPDPEIMAAWQKWFAEVGDRFVDSGNPFGGGVEVSRSDSRPLGPADTPATGYAIVTADSLEAAQGLLEGCPFSTAVRVYPAMAM